MTQPLQREAATTMWGVKHSQGIRWCDNESTARNDMAALAAQDEKIQRQVRGKVRLVRREIGALEVVENPYETSQEN